MMIIITTINRFFIISKKNILLHSSKHFLSLMNRRTFLLFYLHLMPQFLNNEVFQQHFITFNKTFFVVNESINTNIFIVLFIFDASIFDNKIF